MALESLLQPPINRIDLTGEWDGDPASQVALHAKIEFVSVPNTILPLLDLSNDGVELLQFEGPTKLPEASRLPHGLEEVSDEKYINESTRGGRRRKNHPIGLKRIANGGTEPLNETPRTLYQKGMELSPPSTKRRLFPPSPTSTVSRMPLFDDLILGLEDESFCHRDDVNDGFDGKISRSTDISATGISESSGANSTAHSLGTACAINGDQDAEMAARLSDLKAAIDAVDNSRAVPVKDLYGGEKGAVSKIPVKAQRLIRSSDTYEEISYASESEGNLGNMSASPSKRGSPPPEEVLAAGNEKPSFMPTTPRNEQFSPVKLSNTLPTDMTKYWVDQEPPQSPTREPSHGVGRKVPLFDRSSCPQSEPRGSRRPTQLTLQRDAAITTQRGEQSQKDNVRSEYVSNWLEKNEGNGFVKEYSQSQFLYPIGYLTKLENNYEENSPTCAEGRIKNTAIVEQKETEKPITLPSPSPSSQLNMPWNSAKELAVKFDSGKYPDMVSTIPALELAVVEELGKDFYILSPETSVPTAHTIEFDLKVRLGPLQPGGWQLLSVPGLPVDKHGGKGTVKLTVLHSSSNKRLDCGTGGLLGLERDGTGYVGNFDITEPLALSLRAVEQLTSESRDNRILNNEISVVLRRRRRLGTGAVVEYTAVCALSLYQKILCADGGSVAVIISDGPGGDFEWTMENGNRDFRVNRKAASSRDIGTTKVRIFCKENELDGCFRIIWEVPYETQISQSWVPKLYFEKPATHAEYVPSLRSKYGMGLPGTPVLRAETESGESTPFEREKVARKWKPERLEDWGDLGLPAIETESITYWCMHQLVWLVMLFLTILQELGALFQNHLEYVPLGPMKIFLMSLVVQSVVLFNQQFGYPIIESQLNRRASLGLPYLRSYVQIEPRLGSFNWFARVNATFVDRGLLGHIFNVVNCGWGITSITGENIGSVEKNAWEEGELQNTAAKIMTQIAGISDVGAVFPTGTGVDCEGTNNFFNFSTSNLRQTKLSNSNSNRTASEPTAARAGNVLPAKPSLRDRIDRFLGWKGPLD